MAQKQITIRLNERTERLVHEISPSGEVNYNFAVNQVFHRYDVLCEHLKPTLSQGEWNAIFQAYNGHAWNKDIELEAKAFAFDIKQAIVYDGNVRDLLGIKTAYDYSIDDEDNADAILNDEAAAAFIAKIDKLTIPQIIAVFKEAQAFWTPKHPVPNDEN